MADRPGRVHSIAGAPSARFGMAILESAPDAVFIKDRERRYVLVNEQFLALAACSPDEVLGRTDQEIFGGRSDGIDGDLRALDGSWVRSEDEPFLGRDGRTRTVITTKVPLRDETGAVTHLLGLLQDITRLSDAEAALRLSKEDLERRVDERTEALRSAHQELLRKERLAVLGQLAGGLAHQIRNPLAAMTNAASVLKRRLGAEPDPDVRQALAIIREEVWEANRIITDLLDYARIRPPSIAPVSVSALVDSALGMAKPTPEIQIERSIPRELLARVDERQTRDALGNVIRNAIEAMPGGGTLTIEASAEGEMVMIAIEDTGPGLSRASLAYLFEPLVTSKPLGMGFGLATARALIENQNGTIRCSSHVGVGARFEIRVPRT